MVLDDFFSEKRDGERTRKLLQARTLDSQLASPLDRLAANIADMVFFLPVLALVMSPFSRRAKEAQVLGLDDAWTLAVISGAFAGFFALIIYQTFFVAIYGGTPGKLVLRLRVVSIWGVHLRPRPIEALIRSVVWALELALLGAPFLAVFSNIKRRPLHDRAGDTAVIAISRSRQSGLASLPEMSVASGFQSAVLAVLTLVVVVNFAEYRKHQDSLQAAIVQREDEGRLCPEVREALQEGRRAASAGPPSLAERLETALILFTTGAIDRECLGQEADMAFWRNREPALSYLAKGLALRDRQSEKALSYLERACDADKALPDGSRGVCAMATLARDVIDMRRPAEDPPSVAGDGKKDSRETDDDDDSAASAAETARLKAKREKLEVDAGAALASVTVDSPGYLKADAVRHLLTGDIQLNSGARFEPTDSIDRALTLIDSFRGPRRAGAFFARKRVQALWQAGKKSDASVVMRAAGDLVDTGARVELTRWMCDAETEVGGCSERARMACGELAATVDQSVSWFAKPEVAVAYIRGATCAGNVNFRALKDKFPIEDAKSYLDALASLRAGQLNEARERLASIVDGGDDSHDAFSVEAALKLTELARSKADLADVADSWMALSPQDAGFRQLGRKLVFKLVSFKAWSEAVSVGVKLTKSAGVDHQTFAVLATAANGAGEYKLASAFSRGIRGGRRPDASGERQPASLSGGVSTRAPTAASAGSSTQGAAPIGPANSVPTKETP